MNQKFSPWEPTTLGYGYPALILLFSEMNMFFPDPKWEKAYQAYIDLLTKELKTNGFLDPSLFAGLTGICFTIQFAAEQNPKYVKLHASLHFLLLHQIQKYYLIPIELAEKEGKLPLPIQYGIISGLNGVLAYLLNYSTHQASKTIIHKILKHIVRVAGLIRVGSYEIPGWYANANYLLLKDGAKMYPKGVVEKHLDTYREGCFDTGMAHGVSGCLAVLAKALLHGIEVPNHIKSMYAIINWLKNTKQNVGKIKQVWPKRFAFNPKKKNYVEIRSDVYFDSWSYGAPGISNAMILAASSLKDSHLYNYCINDFISISTRLQISKDLNCPSFFYGRSGNLTIIHQIYLATHLDIFSKSAQKLAELLVEQYNDQSPFGFKCIPPTNDLESTFSIDNIGLITGVSGIILSLLFSISENHRPWTQIFLLN
ncbi:lanthionine synthetase C family protein [Candidatus Rhabdochlamydia porcellionis]|nr:lanthionine synthetase C family protein [Candidatus Rhabdochlamydia porcellionis]